MNEAMLHDPARHEPLRPLPWDESQARAAIQRIVLDTEARFTEDGYWPLHPLDAEGDEAPGQVETPLYHGACGVFWGLHYLEAVGAATLSRSYVAELDRLSLPFADGAPSEAELRIAQAQLVGWLEGLFHGIQAALFAQQMSAKAQIEEMRRQASIPAQIAGPQGQHTGPGQYL